MTDKPSEIIERAAAMIDASEVIGVEVNHPPESRFRQLWPVEAKPLVELLRASTGYWRLYEDRGWSDQRLRSSVGAAGCAALALAEKVLAIPAEATEALAAANGADVPELLPPAVD